MDVTEQDRSAERPYPPSALRLEEAARRGQVPRSADLVCAAAVLGGLVVLGWLGESLARQLAGAMAALLDGRAEPLAGTSSLGRDFLAAAAPLAASAGLLAAAAWAVAAAVGGLQGGLRTSWQGIRLDMERLSPAQGFSRMLSRRAFVRAAAAVCKVAAVGLVAAAAIRSALPEVLRSSLWSGREMLPRAAALAYGIGLRVGAAVAVLAILDYLYQWWEHRQELMMTRREFLEDVKRSEGDPAVRRRRRQQATRLAGAAAWQAGLSAKRTASRTARASVVVTSRGGAAAALQAFPGGKAWRLAARGRGAIGARIRDAAEGAGVRVVESDDLVRLLFARCGVGTVVPRGAQEALAAILDDGATPQGRAALAWTSNPRPIAVGDPKA